MTGPPGNVERRPLDTDGATTQKPQPEVKSTLASASDNPGTPPESWLLHRSIATAHGITADRLAFVVLVEVRGGKYRRRTFLTLAAAQNAVDRATARGAEARVQLCELRPLGGAQ